MVAPVILLPMGSIDKGTGVGQSHFYPFPSSETGEGGKIC